MRKNILSVLLLGLSFSSSSFSASDYTGEFNITGFSVMDGNGVFELYGSWPNVGICPKSNRHIVGQHSTDTELSQKAKYNSILAAYMAGKTVELYIDDCTSAGYPNVKGIYIPKR